MSKTITIYTWGNQVRKQKPANSEFNICVTGVSSYKPHGINLKKVDGRDSRLQEKLMRQPKFELYMKQAISSIETKGYQIISVNCHKGRHRSVGFAILLSKEMEKLGYVTNVIHLDLKV
jgi:RNase adaptor protein for sRNA GlmZ degradation